MCKWFDSASTESGLRCTLHRFAAACDTAGIKISTVKTDVLHVSKNTKQCLLQLSGATQRHVYKFTYLGVAFTSDGRQNEELDIHIGKTIAIMRASYYSVVVRPELSRKSEALPFWNSLCPFSPTLSLYGNETLVMIKRGQSQVQASKMRFLQKIKRVTSSTRCTFLKIRKYLEPLFLQIERSQLR